MDRCYYLAEHVLLDILIYLPVMSLLRFKAVCKHWCSLIESPAFISEHVAHHRDNNEEDNFIVLGVHRDLQPWEPKFAFLSGSQCEECVYDIGSGKFWYPDNFNVFPFGYCDGIVCLERGVEIALWNPALKQVRHMPPPLFSNRLLKGKTCCYKSFGADLKSNDYKMVSFLSVYNHMERNPMVGNQVEVYNLRGDDSWRIIYKDDVLPFHDIYTEDAVSSSKSGMCFWLARYYDETMVLLSFDFSDDVFMTMRLPDEGDEGGFPSKLYLDLLDDKVVYIVEKKSNETAVFLDIWMLLEFGVEESWNMIYKVGPFFHLDMIDFPGLSKNGEFLICTKSNKLYLYNLHTQQGNYIQSCNLEPLGPGQPICYNASLVSLKKANTVKANTVI